MADHIRVLTDDQLQEAVGTPGLQRQVAFEGDGYWFGHVEAAAEAMSGWHHHGEHVTLGYVTRGQIHLEYGPGGREGVDVGEGQYFTVPPGLVHREGNTGREPADVVLVRVGQGPQVFPMDGPEEG